MQCKRCLYTNKHPLHLLFDEEGICSGCRVHEEKDIIDWSERLSKLKSIAKEYGSNSGKNYDCIVPVSGARDSYFIVHIVKNILGLNPLLVSYNKHYNTAIGHRNLANLRIKFDCDLIHQTISPVTIKRITRETFRRLGSVYWHCIAGETVFPVQCAVKFKIPLIIWGAHQGVDQVGMFSHYDEVEMTRKFRKEHDLMGYEAEDLYGELENLREEELHQFHYPDDFHLQEIGVRGIYLNNYIRWDSKQQHEQMIDFYGYETASNKRSFDFYNDVDSFVYLNLHDHIKYLKHGYTKVVDHACREIRLKRLKKVDALNLVNQFSLNMPAYNEIFCNWLGIDDAALNLVLDQLRNPTMWTRNNNWEWKLITSDRTPLLVDEEFEKDLTSDLNSFHLTQKYQSSDVCDDFVLLGHGLRR